MKSPQDLKAHAVARSQSEVADVFESSCRRKVNPVADRSGSLPIAKKHRYRTWRPRAKTSAGTAQAISNAIIAGTQLPSNLRINIRGFVVTDAEFVIQKVLASGLLLAVLLAYLVLVAQFTSFTDPILDHPGRSYGADWSDRDSCFDGHNAEYSVAHGDRDVARHGGVQQHSDRRLRQRASQRRTRLGRCRSRRVPHPLASRS